MGLMADPARPAMLSIDMRKVEVLLALPEPGDCRGFFFDERQIMAREAHVIVSLIESLELLVWIACAQERMLRREVRQMTGRAVTECRRLVNYW